MPLEIYGGPPAGMTAEEITGALHVPGGYAARFALAPAQAAHDDLANRLCLQGVLDAINSKITTRCHLPARMVLVFHPHIQTLPDLACEAPEKIVTGGGQEPHVMAAFCLGSRLAASGQVRVPGAAATPAGIVKAINVLLLDMTSRRPDGRGENGRQRG